MKIYTALVFLLMSSTTALLYAAAPTSQPLRVDINSEGRKDMRTIGWHNWHPAGGVFCLSFDDVTVSLRAGSAGGDVSLQGSKVLVIRGVTLGADAAVATGDAPVMEVQFEGLCAGPPIFARGDSRFQLLIRNPVAK